MDDSAKSKIKIRAIGVGCAGISALDLLTTNVERIAIDTDSSSLARSRADRKILLGDGCGTAGNTESAKAAASSSEKELLEISCGCDVIFIICGLGGGTGSVIAPLISKLVSDEKKSSIFVYSFMPLSIEGNDRTNLAERAFNYLKNHSNAAFSLPNDIILARSTSPVAEALKEADNHAASSISLISEIISGNGVVNVDLASIGKVFSSEFSDTFIAYGKGHGETSVEEAVMSLSKAPTLPHCGENFTADNVLINLRCPPKFGMNKMQLLLESVAQKFSAKGRIAFGAVADESLSDSIEVCTIGICSKSEKFSPPPIPREHPNPSVESDSLEKNTADNTQPCPEKQTVVNDATSDASPVSSVEETPKHKKRFFSLIRKRMGASKSSENTVNAPEQSEFSFVEMSEQRGFFEDTPPNVRNGEDLDVPTFMRRGIKINL